MVLKEDVLPSRLIPYKVKEINVRKMNPKDLSLLSKAIHTNDFGFAVEAICGTTDLSVDQMTIADFYFIFIRHRIMSYTHNPLTSKWTCDGELYTASKEQTDCSEEELEVVRKLPKKLTHEQLAELPENIKQKMQVDIVRCGHKMKHQLSMSDLKVVQLPENLKLDEDLDFPRAHLLAEIYEAMQDPKLSHIVDAAKWIKHGSNLADKIEHLLAQEDLDLFQRAMLANDTIFGVGRTVSVKCEVCGTEALSALDLSPEIFFQ